MRLNGGTEKSEKTSEKNNEDPVAENEGRVRRGERDEERNWERKSVEGEIGSQLT